jgi:Cu(I)/Ag(I) efflux system membrane protein CusA/SilA
VSRVRSAFYNIDRIARDIDAVRPVSGVTSAFAERLSCGRYIDVDIDRDMNSEVP